MTERANHRVAYFNGKIVPERDVLIPFRDRSWKYGDGGFDMTRTFEGSPFRLKEHIDRFYRSLRYLQIDPGISPKEMVQASEEVVARNEHLRAAARLEIVAVHGRSHGDEMQIVTVIHHGIEAFGGAAFDVRLIGKCGFLIGFQRGFVIAGADVDMRGHVHDMSRGRRKFCQTIGSRQRAFRR